MIKGVYAIPPDVDFLKCLAEGVLKEAGGDPFVLADMLVLLPTRRACRTFREIFPRIAGAKATLLPRLQPLGDIDEAELYFADIGDLDPNIPPAVSPLRRQLLLARLIRQRDPEMPLDQAAQLAEALGRLLDEVQTERRDFAALETLVPAEYAEHWQETLQFLKILTDHWPSMLADEKALDPAERRNRVIATQAETWRRAPPPHMVIAAGSTGSMPATSDLLTVIASLPKGVVILPGLDEGLDETAWQKIEETHPQFGMKQWLDKTGVARKDVKHWPVCAAKSTPRVRLLQEAMRPAETTEDWRKLDRKKIPVGAVKGLSRLTLNNIQEEAQTIALLLRATLEDKDKSAALVTSDRSLAERVAEELARWDIQANDSAGKSLASMPAGSFLLDILAAVRPEATPIDYLALLKHPRAACGLDPVECRNRARDAEIHVWRVPKPRDGDHAKLHEWIDTFKADLQMLGGKWRRKQPLAQWIKEHREVAEKFAATANEDGALRIWINEDGEAAAKWLSDWLLAAQDFPVLDGAEYADLFAGLLRLQKLRLSYGQHPRISILGPLEARLLQPDLLILGGLNEGSWPPEAEVDPWMSRPMKNKFGLPLPERRVGLSAHDFVQLASAPQVVLTRAQRAGNAPAVPSRFLLQLETVLHALGYQTDVEDVLATREPWEQWSLALDRPKTIVAAPSPKPCPPVSVRPRSLHVTEIGTWQRNPYAIYAKHILGLRKLDPLEVDATAADRGIIIHKAFENFIRRHGGELPADPLEALIAIGREVFAPYNEWPHVVAFWWPRFERAAAWFVDKEFERRAVGIVPLKPEAEGTTTLANGFTLKGRADRVDRLADGSLAIIDYKTGAVPTRSDVKSGIEPQLSLLALIGCEGGFKDISSVATSEIAYWKFTGSTGGDIVSIDGPIDTLITEAKTGLESLVQQFADPNMPYLAVPRPGLQPRYDDYAHLARMAEWGRMTDDI